VKSYKGNSWGFPKGKIDRDEDKVSCAVREVFEEVGYDCSEKINAEEYLEMQWQQQVMRLYVVPGVPEETVFETRTKKEIGEIAWQKIKDLPTSKDAHGKSKPFWMVGPFIARLLKWLEKHERKKKQEKKQEEKKGKAPSQKQQPALPPATAPPMAQTKGGGQAQAQAQGNRRQAEQQAEHRADTSVGKQKAIPLGIKPSSRSMASDAKVNSVVSGKQVAVLQRTPGPSSATGIVIDAVGRPTRGHAFLDFAFHQRAVVDALVGVR